MTTRAERRAYAARAKADARRKIAADGLPITPRTVGRVAAMHGTCDCWMCTTLTLRYRRPEPTRAIAARDAIALRS